MHRTVNQAKGLTHNQHRFQGSPCIYVILIHDEHPWGVKHRPLTHPDAGSPGYDAPWQTDHCWEWEFSWSASIKMQPALGGGIAQLVEHWTLDQKVTCSTPGRSGRRIFSSRANFLRWLLLIACSTPVLLQQSSYQKCRWQVTAKHTHTPLTQQSQSWLTMLSWHSVGTYQENKVTCNSSGTAYPQLPQLADPGQKSATGAWDLISSKKKKCRQRVIHWTIPQILTHVK